jgi:NAD(P)-dependent dehydrogenase (short-subunit alcohol dehydrogenase family)
MLRGHVALVAGAARGAGRGIAVALVEPAVGQLAARLAQQYGVTDIDGTQPDT